MSRTVTVEVEVPDGLADVIETRRSELSVQLSLPDRRRNLPTSEKSLNSDLSEK